MDPSHWALKWLLSLKDQDPEDQLSCPWIPVPQKLWNNVVLATNFGVICYSRAKWYNAVYRQLCVIKGFPWSTRPEDRGTGACSARWAPFPDSSSAFFCCHVWTTGSLASLLFKLVLQVHLKQTLKRGNYKLLLKIYYRLIYLLSSFWILVPHASIQKLFFIFLPMPLSLFLLM